MQKIRHVECMHRIETKQMKAEKERGKSCTEMKQYRCKIKKKLLQKSHARRIDKCCGEKDGLGGGGGIYVYIMHRIELNKAHV